MGSLTSVEQVSAPGKPRVAQIAAPRRERLGFLFVAALIWLFFEFGRPTFTPPVLPLLIAGALFVDWLGKRDKQWSKQTPWWFVLLATIAIGVAFATNTYAAFLSTQVMAPLFLGICLPLQGLLNSVSKVRVLIYTIIGICVYIGAWSVFHGGYGPGEQDENYVAAIMGMGTALAYFSVFAERRIAVKILLGLSTVVFVGALAAASNPSRGGFLGLCAVAAYCLARSPRKILGIAVLVFVAISLRVIAGPDYWEEISKSTDYQDGTGDQRLWLWGSGVRMFKANPVLGVGAGNFRWVIGDYQTPEQVEHFGHSLAGTVVAHSMHVEALAELGLMGVISAVMLTFSTWRGLGKVRKRTARAGRTNPELVQLGIYADAIRCGIVAILVNGIFVSLFYYSYHWVLLAAGSALPFILARLEAASAGTPPVHGSSSSRRAGLVPRGV